MMSSTSWETRDAFTLKDSKPETIVLPENIPPTSAGTLTSGGTRETFQATGKRRPAVGDERSGGGEAPTARQAAVRAAEDGTAPGTGRRRGRLRHPAGHGSLSAGLPGVDAGDRRGGPAGEKQRDAGGRDGDVRRAGRPQRTEGEAVFVPR